MNQEKYKYAFGQWVIDRGGYKYRYLGKNSDGNAVLYSPGIADIDGMSHDDIRPDPDPPEMVAGQLVMVRDKDNPEWEGPYKYVGFDKKRDDAFPHRTNCDQGAWHGLAKPYLPEPQKPELEPVQLDAIRAELSELKAHMQQIENRLPG